MTKSVASFQLLILLVALAVIRPCSAQTASQDYDAAIAARGNGQIELAITYLESAILKNPDYVSALTLLATLEASLKRWQLAEQHIQAAIFFSPDDPDLLLTRARILSWKPDYAEAESIVDRVLANHPDYLDAWMLKGRIAYYQNQFSSAELAFAKARKIAPQNLELLLAMGDVQAAQGDFDAARATYQNAYRLFPNSAEALERSRRDFAENKPWQASVSVSHSKLERIPLNDWLSVVTSLNRTLDENNKLGVSIEYARRFSLNDVQLSTTLNHKIASHLSGYLTLGMTPDDEFLPAWSASAGTDMRWRQGEGKIGNSHVGVDIGYRKYISNKVALFDLWLQQYFFSDQLVFTLKSINSSVSGGNNTNGWLGRVDIAPSDRYHLYAGYADAPESDRGAVTSTKSAFMGVIFHSSNTLDLRIDYARHDRENSYLRKEYVIGLSSKF